MVNRRGCARGLPRGLLIILSKNKPIVILALFACLYAYKRKTAQPDLTAPATCVDKRESQTSEQTVLYVPYEEKTKRVLVNHIQAAQFDRDEVLFQRRDVGFLDELRAVFRILFPKINCRATHYLLTHIFLLALRTYLSLVVAELDGRIVWYIMSANTRGFTRGIVQWLSLAIPASYTNALIKYFEQRIALTFRETLVRYIHDLYIGENQEYYKIGTLDGELENLDHYISSDVTQFCMAAARLYSSIGKPMLDLAIFSARLSRTLGGRAALGMFINYVITAGILKSLSPAFGKLSARETKLEGDYRNAHAKIITNAEEIAFYDGAEIEKQSLTKTFNKLRCHIAKQVKKKAWYAIIENYVLKYSWSASGYLFTSIPVFLPDIINASTHSRHNTSLESSQEHENMGSFVTNKRIVLSVSDAGGRIMYSIKDLAELSSYSHRVYKLIAALFRVRSNKITNVRNLNSKESKDNAGASFTMNDINGKFELSTNRIKFSNVPIVVPGNGYDMSNGELLLDPLTFEVNPAEHLLIVGSNGTGKSSIARLAAGMWPVYRGLLQRSSDVSFLSQRPYFSHGTFRDQVIYPQTRFQMMKHERTDDEILKILERVHLAYVPSREGGLDSEKEWKDVLSGGEKQRLMFARILYAKPKFAIIDEGTSAVSSDIEGQLYEECKKDDITLLTITHRISLLKYHSSKLEVGLGNDGTKWSWESASSKGWQSIDAEIAQLEEFLAELPKLKLRRKEIADELS